MADPRMTPGPVQKVTRNTSPLTNGTWVLVADGAKALLMENIGDADRPVLEVRRADHNENPATGDQGSDRPGRLSGSSGTIRSGVAETDWHQFEKSRFAKGLSDMLYRRAHRDGFSRLIVVAAPRVLGALRKDLHKEVQARIIAEVPLDLTNHPVDEIAHHVTNATIKDVSPKE